MADKNVSARYEQHLVSTRSRPKVAEGGKLIMMPAGNVSTRSRPKVADLVRVQHGELISVSTRSRPKVAELLPVCLI